MSAGLKAGLIGAGVAILFSLLSVVPLLGCVTAVLSLVLYLAVGILAAYWAESPRDVGQGAGAGAVAGLITGLAGGFSLMIINLVRFTGPGAEATLRRQFRQFPPGMRYPWPNIGVGPAALGIAGAALCCGLGMVLAVALGAAGGAIFSSLQRESPVAAEQTPAPTVGPEPGE